MIYDCAIIGTGPAGLAAALVLKIHNKNVIWFGSKTLSEKVRKAEQILNYPGLPAVSGEELCAAFERQIDQMGLEITDVMVTSVMPLGDRYAIIAQNDFFETKTVLLTTGVLAAGMIPGEEQFLGRGVSYCATCDGPLYKNKKIAVICNQARFEHEVNYLAGLADTVYYFPMYKEPGITAENVQVSDSRVISINGENRVISITKKDQTEIAVDGVFCLRNSISPATFLKELEIKDAHISVNRNMETNLPGCFAAGDCTGRPYQYVKAAGEGNAAAHSIIAYLAEHS